MSRAPLGLPSCGSRIPWRAQVAGPDVARYLISRGCRTDILMASALGDVDLVRRHLDSDPTSIRMSVSEQVVSQAESACGRRHLHLDSWRPSHRAFRGSRFRLLSPRAWLKRKTTRSGIDLSQLRFRFEVRATYD
jgi:hypothetical protein